MTDMLWPVLVISVFWVIILTALMLIVGTLAWIDSLSSLQELDILGIMGSIGIGEPVYDFYFSLCLNRKSNAFTSVASRRSLLM